MWTLDGLWLWGSLGEDFSPFWPRPTGPLIMRPLLLWHPP